MPRLACLTALALGTTALIGFDRARAVEASYDTAQAQIQVETFTDGLPSRRQ
jgi:hypothetical protein